MKDKMHPKLTLHLAFFILFLISDGNSHKTSKKKEKWKNY
jgi:hypothetical protein